MADRTPLDRTVVAFRQFEANLMAESRALAVALGDLAQ